MPQYDNQNYLAHYGIRGQKWGVRRFQNADGSLTSEGKKRARAEYKADNKAAFEKGRAATDYEYAARYSDRQVARAQKRYDKKLDSKSLERLNYEKATNRKLHEQAKLTEEAVRRHAAQLKKKYGDEAISDIKYDKNGRINEKVLTGGQIVGYTLANVGSVALSALTMAPVTMLVTPSSKSGRGMNVYDQTYLDTVAEDRRRKHVTIE